MSVRIDIPSQEVLLTLRARQGEGYPVEVVVDGTGVFESRVPVVLDPDEIGEAEDYGLALWQALSKGWEEDLQLALAPDPGRITRYRFRLDAASPDLHRISWERLRLPGTTQPIGVDSRTPISRFLPLPGPPFPSDGAGLKVLLAIASPKDLKDPLKPFKVDDEIGSVLDSLKEQIDRRQVILTIMPGQTGVSDAIRARLPGARWITGATTAARIEENLSHQDALHLIAHGQFANAAVLLLESENGAQSPVTHKFAGAQNSEFVFQWASQHPRLVLLQSCMSDAAERPAPMSGLAAAFVREGIPTVVAMRDFVEMTAARDFSAAFYQTLVATGDADTAANAGRARIYRNRKDGDFAIPVLYSRLRGGEALWKPDPLIRSVQNLRVILSRAQEVQHPFPLEVTKVPDLGAVNRQLEQQTSEARTNALATTRDALLKGTRAVIIVGSRGRAKSSLLRKLFVDLASDSSDPVPPILVRMGDCGTTRSSAGGIGAAWEKFAREHFSMVDSLSDQLAAGPVNLLVDGDDDTGAVAIKQGISNIRTFLGADSTRKAVITMDQSAFQADLFKDWFRECPGVVLLISDLRPAQVADYLRTLERPQSDIDALTGPLSDLAAAPWLLAKILNGDGGGLESRFRILENIVKDQLSSIEIPGGDQLARYVMRNVAWTLHTKPAASLDLDDSFEVLRRARGTRDFPLEEFRFRLLNCGVLTSSGPEGIRFAYPGMHSYFTACHISYLPETERRERLLEIVAGLGRTERLKRWEDVLVLLSGHLGEPEKLLEMLLELGFGEGDHLLLAARCYHEACSAGGRVSYEVFETLAESLIWWSLPSSDLSPRSRRKAVDALGLMLEPGRQEKGDQYGNERTRIVGHLFRLGSERVRPTPGSTKRQLDYSNIRLAAMSVLLQNMELSTAFLNSEAAAQLSAAPLLRDLIATWYKGSREDLCAFLDSDADHTELAGVAAFALVSWRGKNASKAFDAIKSRFFRFPVYPDVSWSIIDALIEMNASVAVSVVQDAIGMCAESVPPDPVAEDPDRGSIPSHRVFPLLATYIVYAIGKLGGAIPAKEGLDFLQQALQKGDAMVQARAIRSMAEVIAISDADSAALREFCHLILQDNAATARTVLGLENTPNWKPAELEQLKVYVLEALCHIGDERSIKELRQFYFRSTESRVRDLRQRSWEMAEVIRARLRSPSAKSAIAGSYKTT